MAPKTARFRQVGLSAMLDGWWDNVTRWQGSEPLRMPRRLDASRPPTTRHYPNPNVASARSVRYTMWDGRPTGCPSTAPRCSIELKLAPQSDVNHTIEAKEPLLHI